VLVRLLPSESVVLWLAIHRRNLEVVPYLMGGRRLVQRV
jgi:hypothetical protein